MEIHDSHSDNAGHTNLINALKTVAGNRSPHTEITVASEEEQRILSDTEILLSKSSSQMPRLWKETPESARAHLGAKTRRKLSADPCYTVRAAVMTALFIHGLATHTDVDAALTCSASDEDFWTLLELAHEEDIGFASAEEILATIAA